jgi:nucleoside-diphosphate-sugar epimerase
MTTVALTGAAGFVGRATCRALIDAGNEVRALVRSEAFRSVLPPTAKVVVTGDLAKAKDLERHLAGCDAVIHLAALPAAESAETAATIVATNSLVTERVVRAAAGSGTKRVLYVSSVKAVGEQNTGGPWNEDSLPHPVEPYGQSKLAGEQIVGRLGSQLGIDVVVIRPPMVYGPSVGGNFRHLLALARIAHRVPLPLAGIHNRRSTLFVGNLADTLVLLTDHPAARGKTFFVSDGAPRSTPDIVRAIASALGLHARLFAAPQAMLDAVARVAGKGADMNKLCASLEVDDTPLRHLTGWTAPFSFERAIELTVSPAAYLYD